MAELSRRNFLKTNVCALGLLAGAWYLKQSGILEQEVTKANQALRDFPEQIPGARPIKKDNKYETPGAKYCLVHVEQWHPFFDNKPSAKHCKEDYSAERLEALLSLRRYKWKRINKVQKDIYDILSSLKETIDLRGFFAEGMTRRYSPEEFKGFYEDHLTRALQEMYPTIEEIDEHREEYKFAPSSTIIFGMEGGLKVFQGESGKLNEAAVRNLKNGYDLNHHSISKSRTDYFIEACSIYPEPLVVGVYGGRHRFLNRLKIWNQQNPDKKFSLIEVTPESY